ncbi:MAG: hypothetical protein AAB815_02485 [Patescibacteria group bacterium]
MKKLKLILIVLIALAVLGVLISVFVIKDKIKEVEAIGILADEVNIEKVLAEFTVTEREEDCSETVDGVLETKTCATIDVKFEGKTVKVYAVGSAQSLAGISFPFAGKLEGNIPNAKERLVQLMEENGNTKYKIIK